MAKIHGPMKRSGQVSFVLWDSTFTLKFSVFWWQEPFLQCSVVVTDDVRLPLARFGELRNLGGLANGSHSVLSDETRSQGSSAIIVVVSP